MPADFIVQQLDDEGEPTGVAYEVTEVELFDESGTLLGRFTSATDMMRVLPKYGWPYRIRALRVTDRQVTDLKGAFVCDEWEI